MKYILLIFIFAGIVSCKDEGDALTLNELYEINGLPTNRFSAVINGFNFKTDSASGLKTNTALSMQASDGNVSFVLGVNDIMEGTYDGQQDSLRIFLNYKDVNGQLFSTTQNNKSTNFNVEITRFNRIQSSVSGNFSGTMSSQGADVELIIEDGAFLNVPISQPFFGEMDALIDGKVFQAESCVFTSSTSGGFVFETFLGSGDNDSTTLSIIIEEMLTEKEYSFSLGGITSTYNANTFSTNFFKNKYDGEAGKLIVDKIDLVNNRIQGTFDFRVRNAFGEPVVISNGKLNALIK